MKSLRGAIQKVATGPEYSKDISLDESYDAMMNILNQDVDPVQAAIYLISLRMKRETIEENSGSLKALIDNSDILTTNVSDLVDLAEPYNGFLRNTPISPFVPAVLASCGLPCYSHGLAKVGPKFGLTHHLVLKEFGFDVNKSLNDAAAQINDPDIGWSYIDQSIFCNPLHNLVDLRTRMVKRTVITTIEVLVGPLRGLNKTHLYTGYVHTAYPPIYLHLAKVSGYDSATLVKGVEGGVSPALRQDSKIFHYNGSEELQPKFNPSDISISQNMRAVPLPDLAKSKSGLDEISADIDVKEFASKTAEIGEEALSGKDSPALDSIIYTSSIIYSLIKNKSLFESSDIIRKSIKKGTAKSFFKNAI